MAIKTKTKGKKALKVLVIIVAVIAVIAILMTVSGKHKSDPSLVMQYDTQNPYILTETDISAHRSGGGIAPEESLMAFKNCAENDSFNIDVFEFDLHITKDDVLVLLHDDTLDRTSNVEEVFGETDVRPETKTYEELRQLNIGAKFVDPEGEMPFPDMSDPTDDLRILRVEDVLDYLNSKGDYKYIIEIKNSDDLGRKGVDILYQILVEKNLLDRVIFGTFHAGISEVLKFYFAAITNSKSYEPPSNVLQIPYGAPYNTFGLNTGTAQVINYAHEHDMAVQYWTINDEEDMEYLISIGADCIMSDYPDVLYDVKNK